MKSYAKLIIFLRETDFAFIILYHLKKSQEGKKEGSKKCGIPYYQRRVENSDKQS